jgi:DNA-binding transcriptional LysR family regulator
MPYYLKSFLQSNPTIDLMIDVTNKAKVIESLQNNEVDFSLVSVLPSSMDIGQEILLPNKLFLTSAPDTDIVITKKMNKSVFDKIPLIYREEGSGTRVIMQQYFQKAQITPKVRFELTSSEAVKQAVIAGLGFSIQSVLSIKNELIAKDIRIIPVQGLPLVENWRLIWLKQKKMSVVAGAFLKYIREHKQDVYKNHFSWIEKY